MCFEKFVDWHRQEELEKAGRHVNRGYPVGVSASPEEAAELRKEMAAAPPATVVGQLPNPRELGIGRPATDVESPGPSLLGAVGLVGLKPGVALKANIFAPKSPVEVVQRAKAGEVDPAEVADAINHLVTYHAPDGDQKGRLKELQDATSDFILTILAMADPSPERSTAISRAREAKMWASAAIVLEK
jgi:hypothetical protein